MVRWIAVFVAMTLVDAVWALYTRAIAQSRRSAAATYAALIIVLGGFTTTSYVHDLTLLIPAAAGAFAGTWLTAGKKP